MEKSLFHKMCYTPGIFDNIFRWQFFLERDTKMYFIDILWAQAYNNNNTLLLAAIIYLKKQQQEHSYEKEKRFFF